MAKRPHKQIRLAQNFLKDAGLLRRLVAAAEIGPADTVLEIGSGRGIITAELALVAEKVIAVEKDPALVRTLRKRFRAHGNVEILEKDFLRYGIPMLEYKIFASIPYNITAAIVRKILYDAPAPSEAYLIMQKESARKFAGRPAETQSSLLAKPYFEFRILAQLKRTDFHPVPNVDSVLLRIARRSRPLLPIENAALYRDFVTYGFGRWKRHLRSAFKHVFTYKQWKHLARDLHFPLNVTPTQLTFEQWLGLYQGFKELAVHNKQTPVSRQRSEKFLT